MNGFEWFIVVLAFLADLASYAGGRSYQHFTATERDAGLRRDIRELGALLGRTLVRQEGEQLLELVERTRALIRSDRAAAAALLAERGARRRRSGWCARSAPTSTWRTWPSRCTAGASSPEMRERDGGWLSQAVDRIAARGHPARRSWPPRCGRLGVRPVFTAHPTEAARRTVLYKLRQIADLLAAGGPARDGAARGDDRPAVADRRAADRPAGRGGRGSQRGLVLRRPARGRGARRAGGVRGRAAPAGARPGPGAAPARVRQLDRRRPRRQPERGAGQHRRACSASSTTTGCATRSRS